MTDSKTNHMNDLFAQWDAVASGPVLPDTTTENGMAAHSSTGSACLDFFASVVRDTHLPRWWICFELPTSRTQVWRLRFS